MKPKLPPGKPRLLVELEEETTATLGDVLCSDDKIFNKATVSTGGTRKVTRAPSSNEGFSKAFVVVLQKASFPS